MKGAPVHRARHRARHQPAPPLRARAPGALGAIFFTLCLCCLIAPPARAQPQPLPDTLYAAPGTTLVIPIAFEGEASPYEPIAAWTDDGQVRPADVHRMVLNPPEGARPPIERWLPRRYDWSSAHNENVRRGDLPPGFWVVAVELPDEPVGRSLRIQQQRLPIVWLDSPRQIRDRVPDRAWRSPHAGTPLMRAAADLAELEADQPDRRWRARVMAGGLGAPDAALEEAFADPVVAAYARQFQTRWMAALAELWSIDPALCRRVARRLTALVRFSDDVTAPAWPTDRRTRRELLDLILQPDLDDARRGQAIRAWLDDRPRALAWPADDTGRADADSRAPIGRLNLANLTDSRAIAITRRRGSDEPVTDPTVIEPWGVAPADIRAPEAPLTTDGDNLGAALEIVAEIGPVALVARIGTTLTAARPPGVRLGPMSPDWSMPTWLSGDPPESRPVTIGAIRRGPSIDLERARAPGESEAEPGPGASGRWTLYLEHQALATGSEAGAGPAGRQRPAAQPAPDRIEAARHDTVRVWLGPSGAPSHVLRIRPDGRAVDAQSGEPVTGVRVAREPGRWACELPIPPEAIDRGGVLRIGIERIGPRGRRWAWPRPMLPWQEEPGRAAIDTTAWNAFDRPQ